MTTDATTTEAISSGDDQRRARIKATMKRPIRVRAMGFPFQEAQIPRWWLFGNPLVTQGSNALNLLFPDGERFFIRSVRYYMDRIADDPELLARVKAFFGQEGRHGHEHERYNKILEEQGYDIEGFLSIYRFLAWKVLEPAFPPVLRLSVTAALEHFTATLAENGLTNYMMDNAHPLMRDLLMWHAAEEIEHKSVAFDVLQRVNPSWAVRASGLVLASAGLAAFWALGARMLLAQEKARGVDLKEKMEFLKLDRRLRGEADRRRELFKNAFIEYLRPDFHPDQKDNYELARAYLASVGRLDH